MPTMKSLLIIVFSATLAFAGAHSIQGESLQAQVPPVSPCSCTPVTVSNPFGVPKSFGTAFASLACATLASPAECRVTGTVIWIPAPMTTAQTATVQSAAGFSLIYFNPTAVWPSPILRAKIPCPNITGPSIGFGVRVTDGSLIEGWDQRWTCDGI